MCTHEWVKVSTQHVCQKITEDQRGQKSEIQNLLLMQKQSAVAKAKGGNNCMEATFLTSLGESNADPWEADEVVVTVLLFIGGDALRLRILIYVMRDKHSSYKVPCNKIFLFANRSLTLLTFCHLSHRIIANWVLICLMSLNLLQLFETWRV